MKKKIQSLYKEVECKYCNGSGILTKTCRKCDGKGCDLCKNTGKYVFRANRNRKESIQCPTCKGSGKFRLRIKQKQQKPKRKVTMNPCISPALGREIKAKFTSKKTRVTM